MSKKAIDALCAKVTDFDLNARCAMDGAAYLSGVAACAEETDSATVKACQGSLLSQELALEELAGATFADMGKLL